MDIMLTHPMVIIRGVLQANPFFVPPDDMLEDLRQRTIRDEKRSPTATEGAFSA